MFCWWHPCYVAANILFSILRVLECPTERFENEYATSSNSSAASFGSVEGDGSQIGHSFASCICFICRPRKCGQSTCVSLQFCKRHRVWQQWLGRTPHWTYNFAGFSLLDRGLVWQDIPFWLLPATGNGKDLHITWLPYSKILVWTPPSGALIGWLNFGWEITRIKNRHLFSRYQNWAIRLVFVSGLQQNWLSMMLGKFANKIVENHDPVLSCETCYLKNRCLQTHIKVNLSNHSGWPGRCRNDGDSCTLKNHGRKSSLGMFICAA